jgi:sugar/nucleoside kinase (ribokinase family)
MVKFDIVTIGHFSKDLIKLPNKVSSLPSLGGPPAFVSLSAQKLKAKVSVISKVGEDFKKKQIRFLNKHKVDLSGLQIIKNTFTTSYTLEYNETGDRILTLNSRAQSIDKSDIPDSLETKLFHLSPIANEISSLIIKKLRKRTSYISLDIQGFLRHFRKDGRVYLKSIDDIEMLSNVDIFKASSNEIEIVTKQTDVYHAIKKIVKTGIKIVIVTEGNAGSIFYFNGKMFHIPAAKPKKTVDLTGAGDVYLGAFLAEFILGKEPVWCACVGSASSSFVIEKLGLKGFKSRKHIYDRASKNLEKSYRITKSILL